MKKVFNLGVFILLFVFVSMVSPYKVHAATENITLTYDNAPLQIVTGDKLYFTAPATPFVGAAYTEYFGNQVSLTGGYVRWGFGSSQYYQSVKYNSVTRSLYSYSTGLVLESVSDDWMTWEKTSNTTGVMTFLQDWTYPLIGMYNTSIGANPTKYNFWASQQNFSLFGYIERETLTDPTVTFDSDGGSSIESMVVTYDSTVTLPDAPTKEGYTFEGWLLNGIAFDPGTLITEDITLLATWLEIPPEIYTVSFDASGGSAVSDQSVESSELATTPPNPTKTGSTFSHWYLMDPELHYNFSTPVTQSITLHASYQINIYTVTYMDGETILDTEDVSYGESITGFSPVKNGYSFHGWLLEGISFDLESPITSDITLDASWLEDDVITYTITFNSNGGSDVDHMIVIENMTAIAPDAPTKVNYTFTGWYSDLDLTQVFSFIHTPITENITLYAKWTSSGGGVIIPPEASQSFLVEIISGISGILAIAAAVITKKKGK